MLKRILVPLDGSTCAEHALAYAIGLARAEGAELEVAAYVDPRAILGRSVAEPLGERHVAAALAEAERVVARATARAMKEGVQASGRAGIGEPAEEIVARATAIHADAIVMGTHGRSGFKRLFMGSVAERVLRSAPCPVVIVREKAPAELEREAPPPESDRNAPLVVLRLVEVAPNDFERLYGEIASFMDGPGAELSGLLETELFGSMDETRIVILATFSSHGDWVRAQWDVRLGQLLEEIAANSQTLEFNLYRGDRFAAKASAVR